MASPERREPQPDNLGDTIAGLLGHDLSGAGSWADAARDRLRTGAPTRAMSKRRETLSAG